MGGELWVETQPNLGSVFHFTVRLRLAPLSSLITNGSSGRHSSRQLVFRAWICVYGNGPVMSSPEPNEGMFCGHSREQLNYGYMEWLRKRYACSREPSFVELREIVDSRVKLASRSYRAGVRFALAAMAAYGKIIIDRISTVALGGVVAIRS